MTTPKSNNNDNDISNREFLNRIDLDFETTSNNKQTTNNQQQPTNKQQSTNNRQRTINNRQQTNNKQQTTIKNKNKKNNGKIF